MRNSFNEKRSVNQGFTLIELMIVMAIVAILMAIAIPEYLRFQSISKRTEAYSVLYAIRNAETSYYLEKDEYIVNPLNIWLTRTIGKIPKFYRYVTYISADPKMGYGVLIGGNIDADPLLDGLVMVVQDPGPLPIAYPEGIFLISDDLVN